MGDSCCASYSIGAIKAEIEQQLGVYVHSIATGSTAAADVWSSYFGSVNDQVAGVCDELRSTPELAGGYNAVGFSQGGQFLRAVVQRCQHTGPTAHTLVTLGAQHQGVTNVPGCNTVPANLSGVQSLGSALLTRTGCETMQTVLGQGAYLPWVRDYVVQAQYFKDPFRLDTYLAYNPFLPDINNELPAPRKKVQYASNLASLARLVLFRFAQDSTVVPRDSAWFSTLRGSELVELRGSPLYQEDWIGLRALDESGRLELVEAPGAHMQFTLQWFTEQVIQPYLTGSSASAHAAAAAA
ncbi:palmitoyl protein thioesterase [Haematococcus lacustris]